MRTRTLLVLAAVGLGGCSDPLGPQESELERNERTWMSADLTAYEFHFRRLCFCGPDTTREVIIEVILDNVSSVRDAETGEELPDPDSYPTVVDLFAEIRDAIEREADVIEVEYDDLFGHPVSAAFDFVLNAADEEMSFIVTEFTPIDVIDLNRAPASVTAG